MSVTTRNEVRELLFKTFGRDIQICDARHDFVVSLLPQDQEGADPKNPIKCVFAKACIRITGFPAVFWKRIAYVCQVDAKGVKRCYRYILRKNVVDLISKFDQGSISMPIGAGILLSAPGRKERLPHVRKQSKKYRQTLGGKIKDRQSKARRAYRNAEAKLHQVEEQYQTAALNEKPRSPKMTAISKRRQEAKEVVVRARENLVAAEQSVKQAREQRLLRDPVVFDLSTRNGARGNYHFA